MKVWTDVVSTVFVTVVVGVGIDKHSHTEEIAELTEYEIIAGGLGILAGARFL